MPGMIRMLQATIALSNEPHLEARINENMKTNELVSALSIMEREVLSMDLHRAIALLKAVIGGKRTHEEFMRQCLEIQGLV